AGVTVSVSGGADVDAASPVGDFAASSSATASSAVARDTDESAARAATFASESPRRFVIVLAPQDLEQFQIRDRRREARAHHADVVVLEHPAERDAVVERDRRRGGARFFARAAQHLARREQPARARRTVVMKGAAKVADALTSDLAPVLANDDG